MVFSAKAKISVILNSPNHGQLLTDLLQIFCGIFSNITVAHRVVKQV